MALQTKYRQALFRERQTSGTSFRESDLRILPPVSETLSADSYLSGRFSPARHTRSLVYFEPSARRVSEFLHGVSARIDEPPDFRDIQIRTVRHRNRRSRSAVY